MNVDEENSSRGDGIFGPGAARAEMEGAGELNQQHRESCQERTRERHRPYRCTIRQSGLPLVGRRR